MKRIIILLILILFTGCNSNKQDENFFVNKANLNEQVINDKIVNNVNFYDISVIYDRGITTFRASVKSDDSIVIDSIKVSFKNKNGSNITTLEGYIGKNVKEESYLVITSDIDLTNAYSIEIEF